MWLRCLLMSFRFPRVFALIPVAGVAALALMILSAGLPAGAVGRSRTDRKLLIYCARVVLGLGGPSATPISGSADSQVVSQLAVFRRTRSAADALPRATLLRETLAHAHARTYDPAAAVLLMRDGTKSAVYAVPATMALPTLPAGCDHLRQLGGARAYLASQADETGSGPGACLIWTQLEQSTPSGPAFPGAAPPKPTSAIGVSSAVCESEAILSGYVGALGDPLLGSRNRRIALIPDGVSAITYTFPDGQRFTVPVAGNLAAPPASLTIQTQPRHSTAADWGRLLSAHLPTIVTENGPGPGPVATLTRPGSLIVDAVGSIAFLRSLLTSSSSGTSSSSASESASCSVRTHRCVAVTVTTTCDSHGHCQTRRMIHRYRYVGAKPPAGTTGPDTLSTAPIVARTNRSVTRPTKLTLVLSGVPHRVVVVLLSVSCFSRHAAASSGGPPLKVEVPSRTPIALPGPGRSFHACDVGALVASRQRGAVQVRVVRG